MTACIIDPLSIQGEILLKEWWGTKSVKLDETSILYKIKKIFVTKLIKTGVASQIDLDIRNIHPHIDLILSLDDTKDSFTVAKERFDLLQNSTIVLTSESLIICKNHVKIQIKDGLFMTLFYKKGLGDVENIMPLKQLWIESLKKLILNKPSQ